MAGSKAFSPATDRPGSVEHPAEDLLLTTEGSRAEVRDLNRRAQAARLDKGELQGDPVEVPRERQRELGDYLEGSSPVLLYAGDLVVTTRPVYGVKAQGKPTRRVENGETGVVVATDPKVGTVTVRLRDREWAVDEKHRSALDLAYAQHLYRAQGRTVAEVLVCGGWQTDQASSYVGVTRARETSVVVTDADSLGTPQATCLPPCRPWPPAGPRPTPPWRPPPSSSRPSRLGRSHPLLKSRKSERPTVRSSRPPRSPWWSWSRAGHSSTSPRRNETRRDCSRRAITSVEGRASAPGEEEAVAGRPSQVRRPFTPPFCTIRRYGRACSQSGP